MNPFKSVETTIARLVEGAFGRAFRSEVRPMELARKLAREMDDHRTISVSRVYVPNEYAVWLSRADRVRYEEVEEELIEELSAYLLEHARRENLILTSPPHITFRTDERLSLGEFGIEARLVRPDVQDGGGEAPQPRPVQPYAGVPEADEEHGNTMIYSTSARVGGPVETAQPQARMPRALLAVSGRRLLVPPGGATIGRSRDCDIILEDTGISRRHAELRPGAAVWEIQDLGSTNGVLVNGRAIQGLQPLAPGDRIELGTTEILFELG
jgi:hypothetical protein